MKTINKSKKRPKTKPNKKIKPKKKKKKQMFLVRSFYREKERTGAFFLVVSYVVIIANLILNNN